MAYRLTTKAAAAIRETLERLGQLDPDLTAKGVKKLIANKTQSLNYPGVRYWLVEHGMGRRFDRDTLSKLLNPERRWENYGTKKDAEYLFDLVDAVNALVKHCSEKNKGELEQKLEEAGVKPLSFTNKELYENIDSDGKPIPSDFLPKKSKPKASLFQVPPLPTHFVERAEPFENVKALMLPEERQPGTLVVSAIKGMGGIGKSVLAAALARDEDVRKRFKDGVLWVTLGQNPDIQPLLENWIRNGLGDHNFQPTTTKVASGYLGVLLQNKRMLLVIDDVWKSVDAEPFRVGGEQCCVLVTTREAEIKGVKPYRLDVMSEAEAKEMLGRTFSANTPEIECEAAIEFALAVGRLPLALELAIAVTQEDEIPWQQILKDLKTELEALDRSDSDDPDDLKDRELSLKACFNLSLRKLSRERLSYFAWLGLLPDDAVITCKMAATLWTLSETKVIKTLRDFKNKSLLQPSGEVYYDRDNSGNKISLPTYRMHDLMHAYAMDLIRADRESEDKHALPGLGLPLEAAHAALLARYQTKTQSLKLDQSGWHTLTNDGYIHKHLTWHMVQAAQPEAIHDLLKETDATGHNGWHTACDCLGQSSIFIADVNKAWSLIEKETEQASSERMANLIGLQSRYLLITASLNNLANIPVKLLLQLVAKGVWTPEQGLAYGHQIPNNSKRSQCLLSVANFFSGNQKHSILIKALDAAQQIEKAETRARALTDVGQNLPRALPEALNTIKQIRDRHRRTDALIKLVPHLPEALLSEALKAALKLHRESYDAKALVALLSQNLPKSLLPEALETARQGYNCAFRAKTLTALGKCLPEALPEALEAARQIQDARLRAESLIALGRYLPEALPEALEAARQIQDEGWQASVLLELGQQLPEVLPEALEAAQKIFGDRRARNFRVWVLTKLCQHLSEALPEALKAVRELNSGDEDEVRALIKLGKYLPEVLPKALDTARKIECVNDRAAMEKAALLTVVGQHLPEALPEALSLGRQIKEAKKRAEALTTVGQHLPEVIPEALEAVQQIVNKEERVRALTALITHLPESLLPKALKIARKIQDEKSQAEVLAAMVPHLPEAFSETLEVIQKVKDPDTSRQEKVLIALGEHLPEALLPQFLEIVRQILWGTDRIEVLTVLGKQFPEALFEALDTARHLFPYQRAKTLIALGKQFPEAIPEALDAARQLRELDEKVDVLDALGPCLPEPLFPKALEIARQIRFNKFRVWALIALARHFPNALPEALDAVRRMQFKDERVEALAALGPCLPESLLHEALHAAEQIDPSAIRVRALINLAPHLPDALLPKALDAARQIEYEEYRARVLIALGHRLPDLLPEALKAAQQIPFSRPQADVMIALGHYLPQSLLPKALDAARQIQHTVHRVRVLTALGQHLPEALRSEVLDTVQQIQYEAALTTIRQYFPTELPEVRDKAQKISYGWANNEEVLRAFTPIFIQQSKIFTQQSQVTYSKYPRLLSTCYRASALKVLSASIPLMLTLGGKPALKEMKEAITDVCGWWP